MTGDRVDFSTPRRTRVLVIALVAMVHVSVVLGLIRAFAPDFTKQVADQLMSAFTVTGSTPPPSPSPTSPPRQLQHPGAAAEAGKQALPKEAAAPKPRIAIATQAAPPTAGRGSDNSSGARDRGQGTGGGGHGNGTGSGDGGRGQGGGKPSPLDKISGDINSARDYPAAGRELRQGGEVIIELTVGADGRVSACRIYTASRDAEADRITCRLATARFRFRPRLDATGNPVPGVYHWRQRWWNPRDGN